MYPILFEWGSFVIPSWHVFYMLGALVAYKLLIFLARFSNSAPRHESLSRLFVVCYAAGYLGARFLSILIEESHISGVWPIVQGLLRFGAMTLYGGIIGAFVAGTLYCIVARLSFPDCFDMGMLSGFAALIFGRIGCFLNGDDYGKAVAIDHKGHAPWWSVTFPVLNDGLPRWPVQLIEAGCVFGLVFCLGWFFTHKTLKPRPGMVGFLCVVFYANMRFMLEFLRDDFRGFVLGNWLSTSQFIALITLFLSGCIAPFWLKHSNP